MQTENEISVAIMQDMKMKQMESGPSALSC
jgi:hypothetical protein